MHRIFRVKAYEAEHGPHFNEEHARKAVSKMENEDGTRGPHWSVEETTALASQYGINLGSRFNRYDWFVALNMVYSDYYKVIISMTNSNSTKHFVELAKAWINDKDIDEGKMWYYYIYVMCDKIRQAEMECYEEEVEKRDKYEDDDDDEFERIGLFRRGGRRGGMMRGGRRVYSTSRARDYEEMAKCQVLLDKLGVDNEPARENDKILELQKEVSELKNIIRKANQMVPPPMKEMLPQDMKNAMDKVGQ